eukprot:6984328-Ditylum_brightwellii.AAC.2
MAAGHNVFIKQHHGVNRIVKSKLWKDHCDDTGQHPTSMSRVGTHHQNAIAKWTTSTYVQSVRTMLLHADIYWPTASDLMLWPFAFSYAADI